LTDSTHVGRICIVDATEESRDERAVGAELQDPNGRFDRVDLKR